MTPGGPRLDPDRVLALSYVPTRCREAIAALWHLDLALGAVVGAGREPMIARIKLAWWREALHNLDSDPISGEPVLAALRALPALGVGGAELAGMEEGWIALLDQGRLGDGAFDTYAAARGGTLFTLAARLLGGEASAAIAKAGEGWALADLARHCADREEAQAARALARLRLAPLRWPAVLRPLGMLAILAARDAEPGRTALERQGSPARMLLMLKHRITGI